MTVNRRGEALVLSYLRPKCHIVNNNHDFENSGRNVHVHSKLAAFQIAITKAHIQIVLGLKVCFESCKVSQEKR